MAGGWAGRGCVSWEIQVKIRSLLTVGAVAAVATAAALAAPTIASAANGPAPAINVVQPASPASFNNSSGTVATGTVSGVIPARGTSLKKSAALAPTSTSTSHAAAAVSCTTEPDCNLPYGGGPVQHTPHVYLVFWGPKWGTTTYAATENFVKSFFTDLGQPTDYWSTTVQQYTDKSGRPTFGKGLLVGTYWDKNTPEKNVNDTNLGTEAAAAANWLHISDPNNADVVIAAQQGTCFSAPAGQLTFAGNPGTCAQPSPSSGYCAFHDWDYSANPGINLPWVNLPYQPDAGIGCGQTFINSPGTNDGFTITGGHELMEAITDPIANGWLDTNVNDPSGGEVADKCAWGGQLWGENPPDPYGNAKIGPGTFAMQSLWSNAVKGCVMNGGLPLSVTTPATQTATTGKAVSLKIQASIGGANTPLTYTASGLPGGLSINRSTGLISGTPNVTAGTFTSKVVVAYYAGWHTITFGWHVSSPTGEMKGYDAKCLGDYNAKTTAGNKIVLWTCVAGPAQNITFAANSELLVVGGCVTGTTTAFLEPCVGATSQQWTRQSNGEYVLRSNGRCLTAPSANNGTQLTLAACANTANQHWALP
jgi:serine protease